MPEASEVETVRRQVLLPPRSRLVALSFLMLFSELVMIRWLGAHIFYLSYFSNFVLLGSFLGFGLGFLWAGRSSRSLYPLAPVLLGALIAYVYVFDVPLDVTTSDVIFFQSITPSSALPREVVLALLFVSVAAATATIGDGVARTFGLFGPLDAYKWDLVGSLLGIVAFTALAFLGVQPVVWGLIIAGVFLATLPPRYLAVTAGGVVLLMAPLVAEARDTSLSDQERQFITGATDKELIWSPYYRITALETEQGGKAAFVNQTPHWIQIPSEGSPLYERIYDRVAEPRARGGDTLIIGAGSGNDVDAALRNEADRVDAVEIDPRLMDLAKEDHPTDPWSDPRVETHVDDGRAYLERSDQRWDKIVLALPDSLQLVQGQSSLRLESYLFTVDAVRSAREHLAPGGVFAMYNWYRQDWLVDRYAETLAEVFDQPPCVSKLDDNNLVVFVASDDPAALDCPDGEVYQSASGAPDPVTDDHPFPYLRTRSIPGLYLWSGLLVAGLSLALVAGISLAGRRDKAAAVREVTGYADLFFMGVAFMLLETKSVVQFALLFGTTWLVNALVFVGVLASVLVAVAVSRRVTFRRPALVYGALLASLALAYVVPPDRLLDLSMVPRFVAAVSLAFFPIFTANLVFTQRFRDTAHSTVAFGTNLLGAMVGGLLEYTALLTGYRNLLLLVAVVYGLAFVTGRRHLKPATPSTGPPATAPVEPDTPVVYA